MKDDTMTELMFEFFQIHSRADMLNRVEHVHATIEDRPQQTACRAIRVVKDLEAMGVYQLTPALQSRLQIPLPHSGRHQERLLSGNIVADEDQVERRYCRTKVALDGA